MGAVRLVREQNLSIAQAIRDMDLHENLLRKWVNDFTADPTHAFLGHGEMGKYQHFSLSITCINPGLI